MFNIKNKKVTILGGKRSGLALAQLVLAKGGIPKISESAVQDLMDEDFNVWVKKNNCHCEFSGHTRKFIEDSDVIVLSPGVKIDSEPVLWAISKGILVLGEIEFAFQFCQKPVIAVTGSNGKTTTVNLISNVIKAAGFTPCLCGNVGAAFSKFVLDLDSVDFVVLEISSFQLESLLKLDSIYRQENNKTGLSVKGFQPLVGVILNFSQNHLDRHKNLQEYFDAKANLFLNQTAKEFAVLNFKDSWLRKLEGKMSSRIVYFDSPEQNKQDVVNPNRLAVMAVADILGISIKTCQDVFSNFKGVEHRMELVRIIDGVEYINDSKATTVESGRWAITRISDPIILICGGSDKKLEYEPLRELVREKVKKIVVLTQDDLSRKKLHRAFDGVVPIEDYTDMTEALRSARAQAVSGDKVLLSPMCASFDMFSDYEHRGKVFKEIVNKLD